MEGFILTIGVADMILGILGGLCFCFLGPAGTLPIGLGVIAGGVVSGALLMGFSEVMGWIRGIHDAMVDEIDSDRIWFLTTTLPPTEFHYALCRVKGRWGATYSVKDSGDIRIEPSLSDRDEIMEAVHSGAQGQLSAWS